MVSSIKQYTLLFVTYYEDYCYINGLAKTDKVQIHEKPYVCVMQIRFIITLAFRLIRREKMLFLSIVGVSLFSFILYSIVFHYEETAKTSLEKQLQHISFVISVDSTDLKESVETLRMSPLIDSLTIISPQESQQFVENELGIITDSTVNRTDFLPIIAIHPSMACKSNTDFTAIAKLCERIPLTDNILFNGTEQAVYTELYETYRDTKSILIVLFCLIPLLFAFYNAAILGRRVKGDSMIFSQNGATAFFSASPWILYYLFTIGSGLIIACIAFLVNLFAQVSVLNHPYLLSGLRLLIQQTPFLSIAIWHCFTCFVTVLLLYSIAAHHSFWKTQNNR